MYCDSVDVIESLQTSGPHNELLSSFMLFCQCLSSLHLTYTRSVMYRLLVMHGLGLSVSDALTLSVSGIYGLLSVRAST